ncbi:ABC transporter ATP-binding protein [Dactylosporangium roseum]|uniref:ABC transporter ATP-binding protein n=1 Tax=Dactylosporangium roseum TaxID=47989 RepID=A0ABY5ZAI3_9ACTN|nr:ABC transporter ATP-binding protein [Dactylosporangium roseum]UWZ39095.1 ABC transporter ATP-binding protein [Dactylosporangium roseum]
MNAMLEVAGLRKQFLLDGGSSWWGHRRPPVTVTAVDEVSFSVDSGTVLTVVGESGCGKTTVARMLVGLEQPSSGVIRVDGITLSGRRTTAQTGLIQMVSQNPWSALNRRRSIGHALEQPLLVHRPGATKAERARRIGEMLDRIGLAHSYLGKWPRQVSGGELARVVLARALLAEPKVIVLDEPTASLDASVKATVVSLLLDLRTELGLALVLITHEIPVARWMADQAAVMYLGRFVETGPAREVLHRPTHPYTRLLLDSVPHAAAGEPGGGPGRRIPEPGGEVPSAVAVPSGCAYHPRCPHRADTCTASIPPLIVHNGHPVACHRTAHLDLTPRRDRVAQHSEPDSGTAVAGAGQDPRGD